MDASRRNLLISIAVVLAVLQFLIVPWFAAQAAARERLQVLTARLVRSEAVLANKKLIQDTERALSAAAAQTLDRFPRVANVDAFRLEAQPKVIAVGAANGLTVSNFSWLIDGKVEGSGLQFARARVQWSGPVRALAAAQAQLETGFPNVFVREVGVAGPGGGPGITSADIPATLTLVVDLYFRGAP